MKAPGSATTSAATSISSSASAGRLASTTRSSSSGGADAPGRIAIVSSNPVVSSRTGSAATRGTDGEEDPGPTAHSAIVSTSGVGVAAARRRAGRRAHGVRGRGLDGTARQDALQHHHVVLARRPEPEDVAVAQDGASGLERVVVDVQRARGAGVVDAHAAGFHHDAGVVRAHRRKVQAQAGAGRGAERHGAALRENAARARERAPQHGQRGRLRLRHHTLAAPSGGKTEGSLEPRHSRWPPLPHQGIGAPGAPGHAPAARPRGRRARSRSRRWPGSAR